MPDSTSNAAAAEPTTTVAVVTKPAPTQATPKTLPPYKVILHNDDVNEMDHVVQTIVALTTLNLDAAVQRTLEANDTGLSLLLVTHKERAELYQEQFQSASLTVTIEPDE